MKKIECFKIRLLRGKDEEPWVINSSDYILDIPINTQCANSNPVIIDADPFLFVKDNCLYLFYEEKKYSSAGTLKMIQTKDMNNWSKPVTVLQESFHLSYPYVFVDDGCVYMIPESCAVGEVRLYKADSDDLSHFSKDSILLKNTDKRLNITINYSDSSVFKHTDGLYYLMTTLNIYGQNQLFLYVSDNLRGPYIEHPMSPIIKSQKYGRNAGCLFVHENKIYRVAQDCVYRYGDNVHLFEITTLSKDLYKEIMIKENILDISDDYYKEGGHHFNSVEFKGKCIVATDAKEYHYFILNRIIRKIAKII